MPLAGHGRRPTTLRRRAGRPQLKRDPLGGPSPPVVGVTHRMELSQVPIGPRDVIERYLLGQESLDAAAKQLARLWADWLEASHQAQLSGTPAPPDFVPRNLTEPEACGFRELFAAVGDHLARPSVEWLPPSGGGAA